MTKTTEFNPTNLQQIFRVKIQSALDAIAKEYGLQSLQIGNINYDPSKFSCQITGKIEPETDSVAIRERNKLHSEMLGYSDNIIGEWFRSKGKRYKVTEIALNRPKFPLIGVDESGVSLKFSHENGRAFENPNIKFDQEKNPFRPHSYHS